MTTEREYRDKISQYGWDDLLALWKDIEDDNTPGWGPGKAFEYLIVRAFQLEGAYVNWPYRVTIGELTGTEARETIEQVDGFIHTSDGLACLVECKDTSGETSIEPIAKLRNQLLRRPNTSVGVVFSRSGFTEPAALLTGFIAPQVILLWSGDEVKFSLEHRYFCKGLVAKYRVCVAKGIPDYYISQGD